MDARRTALLGAALEMRLDPLPEGAREDVAFQSYLANTMTMDVRAASRALLVLSEMFYPGWEATVNGRRARIYQTNGALRGIVVPAGESRVVLHYAPHSVYAGAVVTVLAFLGTFAAWLWARRARGKLR